MEDVKCPYCGEGYTVDEDYGDDETFEVDCDGCGQVYNVHTSVTMYYQANCSEQKHKWESKEANMKNPHNDGRVWAECTQCEKYQLIDPSKIK